MTIDLLGADPASTTPPPDPWAVFELRLAAYLSVMSDADDDRLVLFAPDTGCLIPVPLADVDVVDDEMLAVETRSEGIEVFSTAQVARVADRIVADIRSGGDVPDPGLLTAQVWGPASGAAAVLRLSLTTDVPTEAADADHRPEVAFPTDRDDLVHRVGEWLAQRFAVELAGEAVEIDDDGDFVLHHGGNRYWMRVRSDQPAVEMFTAVVAEVRSRRQAAVEVNLLNRDHVWTRWVLRHRTIMLTLTMPAVPWVPVNAGMMLQQFLQALDSNSDDLQQRVGRVR